MNEQTIIPLLLTEFHDKLGSLRNQVPRETTFPDIDNKIKVAIGMRRTGKTYFIFQKIAHLIQNGVPLSQILYINLEDDRLLPLTREKTTDSSNLGYGRQGNQTSRRASSRRCHRRAQYTRANRHAGLLFA